MRTPSLIQVPSFPLAGTQLGAILRWAGVPCEGFPPVHPPLHLPGFNPHSLQEQWSNHIWVGLPHPESSLTNLCPRFAVADTVYRALRTERRDQAVMISGESGAGKTEATKRLLQFYAETCPAPERGGAVRDRLLQSNPVLEVRGRQRLRRGLDKKMPGSRHIPIPS